MALTQEQKKELYKWLRKGKPKTIWPALFGTYRHGMQPPKEGSRLMTNGLNRKQRRHGVHAI